MSVYSQMMRVFLATLAAVGHTRVHSQRSISPCFYNGEPRGCFVKENVCAKLGPRNYNLPRIDPGKVGDTNKVYLADGKVVFRKTLAVNPPLFEIRDFLTAKECDRVVHLAVKNGMKIARVLGEKGPVVASDGGYQSRTGETAFLLQDSDKTLKNIQRRIASLTGIPMEIMEESEKFQVGLYGLGQHYHAHYDSSETTKEEFITKPCCHQIQFPHSKSKCMICRYMTVLMYLNDVEEGGETAFPVADVYGVHVNASHINLSKFCGNSGLVVRPRKGTAIMWYNNLRDQQTGWLDRFDSFSLHGGCDVIKGHKWISNIWISASRYNDRHTNSIYSLRWS